MQVFVFYTNLVQFCRNLSGHPLPLAEYDNLFIAIIKNVAKDVHRFFNLGVVTALLVKDVSAVTHHPHLTKEQQQTFAVFLA